MLDKDHFSKLLGMKVIETREGFCTISMEITSELVNGFQIAHGGITYALADSAMAFASNSRGFKCMSIETSISHLKSVKIGDRLISVCSEVHRGRKTGVYQCLITNQEGKLVAHFKGTVHVSEDLW